MTNQLLPYNATAGEKRELARMIQQYDLGKAVRQALEGQRISGVEGELNDELISRTQGRIPYQNGQLRVPDAVFRTGTTGNFESTGQGSAFLGGRGTAITSPRNTPLLDRLGVRTFISPGHNLNIPQFTAGGLTLKNEGATADETGTLAHIELKPQIAIGQTKATKELLEQGRPNQVVEALIAELRADAGRVMDQAAFDLLVDDTDGITTNVTEATTGGGSTPVPITQDVLDDMLRDAFNNKGELEGMAYVGSPKAFELLQAIQTNNVFALDKPSQTINGRRFFGSNELSNHTDGTARLIVGNFAQGLVKAEFGVTDIMVNPFTFATQGEAQVVVTKFFDVKVLDERVFSIYREEV